MRLDTYLREIDQPHAEEGNPLDAYAARAETTVGYLRVHVIRARKPASLRYMRRLAEASEGKVTLIEVLRHYGVSEEELSAA